MECFPGFKLTTKFNMNSFCMGYVDAYAGNGNYLEMEYCLKICTNNFLHPGQVIQRLGAFHALSRSAHDILLFAHLIIYYMHFVQYKY